VLLAEDQGAALEGGHMPYLVCVEELDRNWIAHVPDLPGCFSQHEQREQAITQVPPAVEAYLSWCKGHNLFVSGLTGPMIVSEVIRAWNYENGEEVNAFFACDRPPLLLEEVREIEELLNASRIDFHKSIAEVDFSDLDEQLPEERWSIRGVIQHVASAENWYLDRLGLALPSDQLPVDVMELLEKVRNQSMRMLPELVKRTGVVTMAGETWSSRKVVRRMLWHERDHTDHVQKLRMALIG
jgi:hypothetical protein